MRLIVASCGGSIASVARACGCTRPLISQALNYAKPLSAAIRARLLGLVVHITTRNREGGDGEGAEIHQCEERSPGPETDLGYLKMSGQRAPRRSFASIHWLTVTARVWNDQEFMSMMEACAPRVPINVSPPEAAFVFPTPWAPIPVRIRRMKADAIYQKKGRDRGIWRVYRQHVQVVLDGWPGSPEIALLSFEPFRLWCPKHRYTPGQHITCAACDALTAAIPFARLDITGLGCELDLILALSSAFLGDRAIYSSLEVTRIDLPGDEEQAERRLVTQQHRVPGKRLRKEWKEQGWVGKRVGGLQSGAYIDIYARDALARRDAIANPEPRRAVAHLVGVPHPTRFEARYEPRKLGINAHPRGLLKRLPDNLAELHVLDTEGLDPISAEAMLLSFVRRLGSVKKATAAIGALLRANKAVGKWWRTDQRVLGAMLRRTVDALPTVEVGARARAARHLIQRKLDEAFPVPVAAGPPFGLRWSNAPGPGHPLPGAPGAAVSRVRTPVPSRVMVHQSGLELYWAQGER